MVIQLRKDRHSGIHRPEDDKINSSWRLMWNRKDQPHTIIRCVLYRYILYRFINIPKWQQVIFLFVCLFFFGCYCCCLLYFKNKCKRNIYLDVGKQVEKSKPWSISILARDYDYNLFFLANHAPPFSYTVLLTPYHLMKQLFSHTSSQDSVKESKRNSSPISVVAKVL